MLFLSEAFQFVGVCGGAYYDIGHAALLALGNRPHAHTETQFITTEYLSVGVDVYLAGYRGVVRVGKGFGRLDVESTLLKGC
ncbi:hypothetical protein CIK75_02865 [Glutamicibacter sp. BW78]|nr:hypothetical protein CIK75_02865 [Glutamicibacter sp. BW78]